MTRHGSSSSPTASISLASTRRRSTQRVRRELGLARGRPLVTVVSRADATQGHRTFPRGGGDAAAALPRARFLVVGETGARRTPRYLPRWRIWRRASASAASVTFHRPAIGRARAARRAPRSSVMPSLNEALSNVAARVDGGRRADGGHARRRHAGSDDRRRDGPARRPGDAAALAVAIERLLDQPAMAAAFGRAARRTIEERFSLQAMVTATEQLYTDLLRQRFPGRQAA